MSGLGPITPAARAAARAATEAGQTLVARHRAGGRVDLDGLARELSGASARDGVAGARLRQAAEAELSPVERGQLASRLGRSVDLRTLGLDVGQVALDIVGIFEPTPFADLTNAGISVLRGDPLGAITSAAGALPYLGDLAKAGKLGRWAQTVGRAVDAALASPVAMRVLQAPLAKLGDALNAIPAAALAKAPAAVRETIEGLRAQIARVASPVAREVNAGLSAAAARLGVPEAKLQAALAAPKGSRPAVETYMSAAQRALHLQAFDGGIVRITSKSGHASYGTLGPPGGFVTSAKEFAAIVKEAKGDLKIVEDRLALPRGTLKSDDTLIALIERRDAPDLRIPTGNERGANDKWVPGGYTAGRVIEAVMDFPPSLPFKEIKL